MFVKCIVPSRHGGTLNSRRATSPLVRLVEGEEKREASDHPQIVLPQNWGGTESNRTGSYDKRHLPLSMINFVGLYLTFADHVALVATAQVKFSTRLSTPISISGR
ncbi:uncharacterized protein TNCV_2649881 [Trichonephila clavipes]|nr:uncharacterized protein TNCV_2649881 [Trichonephila clavipes]